MRLTFMVKMFEHSFVPNAIFIAFSDYAEVRFFMAYSAIVSAWGFLVWMEKAYRNKKNLQPSE